MSEDILQDIYEKISKLSESNNHKEQPLYKRLDFIITQLATIAIFGFGIVWKTAILTTRFESDISANRMEVVRINNLLDKYNDTFKDELRYLESRLSFQIQKINDKLDELK